MARRELIISDLSGKEADVDEAVQLIFRRGPGIERPVVVDALAVEVDHLTDAPDIFVVEVRHGNGNNSTELVVNRKELAKLVADGDLDVLLGQSARPTRGRPPVTRR